MGARAAVPWVHRARHTAAVDNREPAATRSPLPVARRPRWPFGILVVSALRLVDALGLILIGFMQQGLPISGFPIIGNPTVTRALDLLFASLIILGVLGLLAGKSWGWVLTMVLVGGGLLFELIRYAIGQPDPVGLLILVISAFYLNQRSVRALAGRHLPDNEIEPE